MQESVLVRARFLDMPRDAKVAPVAKSLAGWSCGTSSLPTFLRYLLPYLYDRLVLENTHLKSHSAKYIVTQEAN